MQLIQEIFQHNEAGK